MTKLRRFLEQDIWEYGVGRERSLKGQAINLLRVLNVSWRGLASNRIFSRAAALAYSSLLALGPLIAVTVLFTGSLIKSDTEAQIKRTLLFIAPSLQELVTLEQDSSGEDMATALDTLIRQIVDGAQSLVDQINTGGSKAFGTLSFLLLAWISIQLLISVETTLNQIWGVHKGRPLGRRIGFYWTFISLGALLGLGSTALLSASSLADLFQWVPYGSQLLEGMLDFSPLLSFAMLVLLLTLFYRFFPNTSVRFKPALVGSLLTAALLFLNNYLSILYVHRVISLQSLYGSVGIIPVLMVGLFLFWVLILLGGQLTYAVQNVGFLADQAAWQRVSPAVREAITLAAFLQVARHFAGCREAPSMNQMSETMGVPSNLLNESLEKLEQMGWIIRVNVKQGADEREDTGFRPALPLEKYSLGRFQEAAHELGNNTMLSRILKTDPILADYRQATVSSQREGVFLRSLDKLIHGEVRPPAQP